MIYEDYIRALIQKQEAIKLLREAEDLEESSGRDVRGAAIRTAQMAIDRRERQLQAMREEMRNSEDVDDRIYYHVFIKKRSPGTVGKLVGYSRSSVFRHARRIRETKKRIKEGLE